MKKVFVILMVLIGCAAYTQAQTTDKKMSREEKKEAQRALEQAAYEEAEKAIDSKAFVLEADRLMFKRGRSAFVSANTNFVSVEGDRASIQVAFNSVLSGPNGIGGITVDGNVTAYTVKKDKKGNLYLTFNVMGTGVSAQVNIALPKGTNQATVEVRPNFNSNRLTLSGTLLPLDQSNVFKGRAF